MNCRAWGCWLAPVVAVLLFVGCGTSPGSESGFTITGTNTVGGTERVGFEDFFAEHQRFENFRHTERFGPTVTVPAARHPSPLISRHQTITFSAPYLGNNLSLEDFLAETSTSAFMVLKDGAVVFERYFHGNHDSALNAGFSMTKSFMSALIGIAIDEGYIGSVDDWVTKYVPELATPAFDGVTIKHLLQMSSGLAFNEDYSDPKSDINRMSYLVQSMSYIDYMKTLKRSETPGTVNRYASINTHLLGIIVARATKRSLSEYLHEQLWEPLGMSSPALWMVDQRGEELAMGGLAVSLSDYARFGLLYLDNGLWQGRQILPKDWVKESTVPDAPHLQPGQKPGSVDSTPGYQYQWWVPRISDKDFLAIGIWGQYLYVDPRAGTVIVKLSADPTSFDPMVEDAQIAYIQALSRGMKLGNAGE